MHECVCPRRWFAFIMSRCHPCVCMSFYQCWSIFVWFRVERHRLPRFQADSFIGLAMPRLVADAEDEQLHWARGLGQPRVREEALISARGKSIGRLEASAVWSS